MILTSKDLPVGPQAKPVEAVPLPQENDHAVPVKPAAPAGPSEDDRVKDKYVLDHAPKGGGVVCETGVFLRDGTEYKLHLVDGEFLVDEPSAMRRKMVVEALLANGFRWLGAVEEKSPPKRESEKYAERIKLMHPDHSEGHPVNAEVLAGRKKVKVEAGYVETDDPKVIEALLKKGYVVQNPHALERSQEKERSG